MPLAGGVAHRAVMSMAEIEAGDDLAERNGNQ